MAKKEKLEIDLPPIDRVDPKGKPKGEVFTEWDILFKDSVTTQKKDQIVERLLTKIAKYKVRDRSVTTSLQFQFHKSDANDYLYNLRVFREFKSPEKTVTKAKPVINNLALANSGPIRTPGPPIPKPPAGVLVISRPVDFINPFPA